MSELAVGTRVIVDGRWYIVELVNPSQDCTSSAHQHGEPHGDGSPGTPKHHHHNPRCFDVPLMAILRPEDKTTDQVSLDETPVYRTRRKDR